MSAPMSTQWIKKNMMGYFSEELGRPLTDAEMRVQRCTEQLEVPDWYRKYQQPSKFLKKYTPIELRPALWKTMNVKGNKVSSSPKKRSPKNTPKKAQRQEQPRTSSADSGYNDTYRISRRAARDRTNSSESSFTPTSSSSFSPAPYSGSDSDVFESPKSKKNDMSIKADDLNSSTSSSIAGRLNTSNTFPRVSPSRKIEHINIVFSKPFPAEQEPLTGNDFSSTSKDIENPPVKSICSTPKTHYTMTKNFSMLDRSNSGISYSSSLHNSTMNPLDNTSILNETKTHASFLIADVSPNGVKERVRVFAGLDDSFSYSTDYVSSDEEVNVQVPPRCSPSPCSERFLTSSKKSTELEKIVQEKRTEQGSLIQEIISELDRSSGGYLTGGYSTSSAISRTISNARSDFVRSMVDSLEHSDKYDNEPLSSTLTYEDDCQSDGGSTDSELAKSTSISFQSYDSADERTVTPLPLYSAYSEEDDSDNDVHWAPCRIHLPRTSSRLSTGSKLSLASSVFGTEARDLSPIERCSPDFNWLAHDLSLEAAKIWNLSGRCDRSETSNSSRQLFRIDETYSSYYMSSSSTLV